MTSLTFLDYPKGQAEGTESMQFVIASTFQRALARLDNQSARAVKTTAFDLQNDPAGRGKRFHRIDRCRDPNFWSLRASRDLRLIVHKTGDRMVLAYVDHHDDAYDWAIRREMKEHPRTGALQIVEVEELVETRAVHERPIAGYVPAATPESPPPPLADRDDDELLRHGVPDAWLDRLRAADTDELLELADHLPQEAQEAVLALAVGETPPEPAVEDTETPAEARPDARRRFRVVEGRDELEAAMAFPWDQWTVFLHPSQQSVADRSFVGPARVGGSAGTGKTIVALHRAWRLSRRDDARVLLTTFSRPLANALVRKLRILAGSRDETVPRVTIASFLDAASELVALDTGHEPKLAKESDERAALARAAEAHPVDGFDETFLYTEWRDVVDGWQLPDERSYLDVSRTGRRSRIGKRQRAALWPLFAATRADLVDRGRPTAPMVFAAAAEAWRPREDKPYRHVVVDEAQDLGPPELRFLAAIVPDDPDALFFAGDLGQRIFQHPFSWAALGVDVRGRSSTLKVNYRTSHQIRSAADRLLPAAVRDMDGVGDERRGTVSLFGGPVPLVMRSADESDEEARVAQWLQDLAAEGFAPGEIGLFVRDRSVIGRAERAAEAAGLVPEFLSGEEEREGGTVAVGTMHYAKGLEFRAVAVMACDDDLLPQAARIEAVVDTAELDEVYATERHLLYVACTRARERLVVSGKRPVSEFLGDLAADSN